MPKNIYKNVFYEKIILFKQQVFRGLIARHYGIFKDNSCNSNKSHFLKFFFIIHMKITQFSFKSRDIAEFELIN